MDPPKQEQSESPLWEYVPLAEFSKPSPPAKEVLRKGLLGLWDKLRPSPTSPGNVVEENSLRLLPTEVMEKISPPPDWRDLLPALEGALKGWMEAEHPGGAAVVGPPYSAVSEVVRLFAESHRWRILEAPEPHGILEGQGGLESLTEKSEAGLVIPSLERFYLRHHKGLQLMRNLLDRLATTRTRILVGCDSWAWTYLSKTIGIDHFLAAPYTLRALDGNRLERFLLDLTSRSSTIPFHCRETDNGKRVLSSRAPLLSGTEGKPDERTDFLEYVAAYSRGIPGIAWSLWRHSLRLVARDEVGEKAREAASADGDRTVWVKPWSRIQLPALPAPAEQNEVFLLHSLLLHGGLSLPLLALMLPLSHHDLNKAAHRLQRNGFIENRQGIYCVTSLGYPAALERLRDEGYLASTI